MGVPYYFTNAMLSITVFDVKNKRLKELCKRVDHLKKDEQEVICHFLDMAVKQDQLKQVMGTGP